MSAVRKCSLEPMICLLVFNLKNGDGIDRRTRCALYAKRPHDKKEFPTVALRACRRELFERGIVQQMQAHVHKRTDVNRQANARIDGRQNVMGGVRCQQRYASLMQPTKALRMQ